MINKLTFYPIHKKILYEIKILFEKLEYRIKIRDEKIKEAEEKKEQFSSMETKLSEKISAGMAKYRKKDEEKREKNSRLRNDLLKMTESYDALKEKFQHFEKHDELRFKEIYDMKSKEARQLALKVVLADRTIKTQQLGRDTIPNDVNEGFTLDELQKDQELEEDENTLKLKDLEAKKNANFKHNILDKISIPRVKQVFQCIIDEAEFLIDTKTIEACEGMTSEEKVPEYIESICRALNIKNEHELNELLALFYKSNKENKKPGDENEENKEKEEESENSEDKQKDNDDVSFEKDNVLNILKEFSRVKAKKAKEKLQNNATSGSSGGGYSVEDNEEAKRERMKYLSETYWEKLGKTISQKTYNVWKALDNSLTAYHDLLFERKQLVENVKDLNEKHGELQKLLTQYMNSDINKELIFPPHKSLKG